MANVVAVIPVRYGAQRFPGKPLAPILSKPMVQWVVEGVSQSQKINSIVVATDDERIAKAVEPLGVDIVMTDSDLPSGSDRVWQAVKDRDEELVLNIQGDEPLIHGELLDQMVTGMMADGDWEMATLGRSMDKESLESMNTAKIVVNRDDQAIYFSRYPIPYSRNNADGDFSHCLKHIGIYGYKKRFLAKFCDHPPTSIELAEGLEQLRALYLGGRIKVIKVDFESWSVEVPEDIAKVEEKLKAMYG